MCFPRGYRWSARRGSLSKRFQLNWAKTTVETLAFARTNSTKSFSKIGSLPFTAVTFKNKSKLLAKLFVHNCSINWDQFQNPSTTYSDQKIRTERRSQIANSQNKTNEQQATQTNIFPNAPNRLNLNSSINNHSQLQPISYSFIHCSTGIVAAPQ